MLKPKLTLESKSSDGTLVIIKDSTGAYSTENTGGYGDINPVRGDLFGGLIAELNTVEDGVLKPTVEASPATANAKEVVKWHIKPERDGYYAFLFVLAPGHNIRLAYPAGKILYNAGKFYLSLKDTIAEQDPIEYVVEPTEPDGLPTVETTEGVLGTPLTDPLYWKEIKTIQDYPLLADGTGAYAALLPYLHTVYSEICIANKTIAFATEGREECPSDEDFRDYVWRDVLYKAANYSGGWGDFKMAGEFLDELVNECSKGGDCGC